VTIQNCAGHAAKEHSLGRPGPNGEITRENRKAKPVLGKDMNPDHLLTFEVEPEGDVVEVHTDANGLEHLISQLLSLREKVRQGEKGLLHLMTDDWGGEELSNQLQGKGAGVTLVHHVKIHGWPR